MRKNGSWRLHMLPMVWPGKVRLAGRAMEPIVKKNMSK